MVFIISHEEVTVKISQRIQTLDAMVSNHYQNIWDCCCDHGFLGMRLLARQAAEKIHFIDCMPTIVNKLTVQLQQRFPQDNQQTAWQVYCLDAAQLPLSKTTKSKPHLIIIAGVGAELMIHLVKTIIASHPHLNLEFLLSPVNDCYLLRSALIEQNMALINEKLIHDNKRFYEAIHVSTSGTHAISPVGSVMWDFSRQQDQAYLTKLLTHYQRIAKQTNHQISAVIKNYQALMTK